MEFSHLTHPSECSFVQYDRYLFQKSESWSYRRGRGSIQLPREREQDYRSGERYPQIFQKSIIKHKSLINRFFSELLSVITRYKIYHLIFWLIYITFWSVLLRSGISWQRDFMNATVLIFFHIIVSYFNNYYLIEWFLFKRKYLTYFSCLSLSILLVCFPLAIATYRYIPLMVDSIQSIWTINFFIYNFIFIFFTVLVSASIKLFRNWYIKEQSNKELQKLNVENELRFLKSQINPHFIFYIQFL